MQIMANNLPALVIIVELVLVDTTKYYGQTWPVLRLLAKKCLLLSQSFNS